MALKLGGLAINLTTENKRKANVHDIFLMQAINAHISI